MTDFVSGKAAIAGCKPGQLQLKWELTKTLRIMKLAAVLLFAAAMHVSAKGVTQDKITLSLKNAPLEKVFDQIEAQSGFVFIYKDETVKDKRVTIQVSNATLSEALDICLKDQALTYKIVGKSVAIKTNRKDAELTIGEVSAGPPLIDVKGRVLNEKGEPVEGVTVRVKGTEKMALTDKNGEFSLVTVERDAMLIFTHITMETFQLKVSGQQELLINLKTKVSSLGEVTVTVNTGYQQVSKERFVGSVATLDSAAFHRRAGMNIIDRLDGTVTGMLFDKKSGFTEQLQNVQIRGVSTLENANKQPLIIVDNFPFRQNLDAINPNDIENITVLKDAAANSIWGAQAGNGVIVITTKKGKYNQPVHLSMSSNITINEKPDLYYYPQISTSDIVDIEHQLFKNGRYDGDLTNKSTWPIISPVVEVLDQRRSGMISAEDSSAQIDAFKQRDIRRDLNKYVYRPAILQQHYINVTGGTNLFNYNFSGGYNRNLNNIQKSKPDDQFTITSNAGFRPIKKLEITTGISYTQGIKKSTNFSLPSKAVPYTQLADAEGNPLAIAESRRLGYVDTVGGGALLDWRYRPLEEIALADSKEVSRFIGLSMGISYRFNSWLNITGMYQYNNQSFNKNDFHSVKSYFVRNLINQYTNLSQSNSDLRNPIPAGGILDIYNNESISTNARGQINFNKTFSGKHLVTSMIVTEVSETKSSGNTNRFFGYNKETGAYKSTIDYVSYFPMYGGLSGNQQIANLGKVIPAQTNRFVSFLGNMSYTYDGRYSFYASARKDGSNFFGVNTNRRWKPLWSTGASWDISKENFYNIKWMSSLRFRASYGFSGNPGNVTGLPTMTYYAGVDQLTGLTFALLNNAPNPDLKWENVRIINTAFDFSLFKNRVTGSLDVYQKKVTDLISVVGYPPSSGVLSLITNVASLKGNGFEINLSSKNITGVFNWQTNFGLSHARMMVSSIASLSNANYNKAQDLVNYSLNAANGRIVYGLASYKWGGLDPVTGDPRGYLKKQLSTNYNSIFNDSLDQQVFHGSSIPLYSGFIGNTFSWKKFTLSANITYRLNFYFRKPTISYNTLVQSLNGHADYYKRWQKPGDEQFTNVPSFVYPVNTDREIFYQNSEINVLRGDNIRLQDIRMQYAWNNKIAPMFPIKRASVFLYVNNLNCILWRKNDFNLDPDFVGGGNAMTPTPVSWTAGLSLDL